MDVLDQVAEGKLVLGDSIGDAQQEGRVAVVLARRARRAVRLPELRRAGREVEAPLEIVGVLEVVEQLVAQLPAEADHVPAPQPGSVACPLEGPVAVEQWSAGAV